MATGHDPYAALRHRDYRLLLAGGVLASVGAEMQGVVVGWELYERTKSPANLGWAGLAQFLPVLLLALPAGHTADRFSRKRLMQLAQSVVALSSVGLALLSMVEGPVALMFGCLVLAGVGRAFSNPPRSALLAHVVPLSVISNAVTWNSTGWQVASVSGPAVGGLAVTIAGGNSVPAYVLAALCNLSCVGLLAPIRPRWVAPSREPRSLATLLAGLHFVRRTQLLLAAITLDLFAVLLGGATALLPIYATDYLHVGSLGLGFLRAAPALGALLMAVLLAYRPPLRRPGSILLAAVAGFGVATIGFGLSRDFSLSLVMLTLAGALDNVSVVIRGTLMQTLTPDDMRGRVAAVNTVFISSSNELGAFESGMTAQWFGATASVVGGGIGTIVVVLLVMLCWPALAHLGPLVVPVEKSMAVDATTG
jgi:MFS family permease